VGNLHNVLNNKPGEITHLNKQNKEFINLELTILPSGNLTIAIENRQFL